MTDPDSQTDLVPHSFQGAVVQQRLNDGYINATAMCLAAGKQLKHYNENQQSREFREALSRSVGIPTHLLVRTLMTGPNEHRGTWVHPQVAIHLGQWVSPEFAVLVSEWVFEWLSGKRSTDRAWQQFEDRVSLVYDNVPDGYWCIFREVADLFATLISKGANPGTKMLLDISVGYHWGQHWRAEKLASMHGERAKFPHYYPTYFAQSLSNPQLASCYPDASLPAFRKWVREVYVPLKMPSYLQTQVQQKRITAQTAHNAIAALEARERQRAIPRAA